MKKSPARETVFKRLKAEMDIESPSLGIHVLCSTRWTVSYNFGRSVWSMSRTQKWRQGSKVLLLRWLSLTTFWHLIGSVNITTYWVLAKQYNKHICQQQKDKISQPWLWLPWSLSITVPVLMCIGRRLLMQLQNLDINEPTLPCHQKVPVRLMKTLHLLFMRL